ncbi:MAG: nitroreductase [Bacteroidota bacterium]
MQYNLSEITAVIRDRRTIFPEQFSTRKVHREQLELLLNNAIWAPTHGMTQPWRFTVFTETALLDLSEQLGRIYLDTVPSEKQNDAKLAKLINRPKLASAVIAVCMKRDETLRISEQDELLAVACAVQNMHLTCTAYGLGGFWSTPAVIHTPAMNHLLGLTGDDKCIGLFYVGYPAVEWPKGQRKPIEYVTTWKQ